MAVNGDMATDFISLRMSLTSGLSLLLNCAVAIDDKLFWKLNLEEEEDEDEEEEEEWVRTLLLELGGRSRWEDEEEAADELCYPFKKKNSLLVYYVVTC